MSNERSPQTILATESRALPLVAPEIWDTRIAAELSLPVCVVGPHGALMHVNEAWRAFTGCTPRDSSLDAVHFEERAALRGAFERTQRTGEGFRLEFRMRRADGQMRWMRASGFMLVAVDGEPEGVACVCIDVTESVRTIQELRGALLDARARSDASGGAPSAPPAFAFQAEAGGEAPDTILVIDDEELVRQTVGSVLVGRGYRTLLAADGLVGVELLRTHRTEVAAVLLDYVLPTLDAPRTLSELKGVRDDLPVVLVSGYEEREVTSRFPPHSLAGFVGKPFVRDALLSTLRRVIAASRSA